MQNNKFRIRSTTVLLSVVAMLLGLALLGLLKVMQAEQAVTLAVASLIAIAGWWAAAKLQGLTNLEAKASSEFIAAISEYSGELRELMYGRHRYLTTIAIPTPTPTSFFKELANDYYNTLYTQHVKVVEAHTKLREAYEANEMALVKLDDHFSYIRFKHDDFIKLFGDVTQQFVDSIPSIRTESQFVEASMILDPLQEALVMQLMMCLDLKKEVLNTFQAKFFGYTLKPREPLNQKDKDKTLKGLATPEVVAAMRKERDDEFINDEEIG